MWPGGLLAQPLNAARSNRTLNYPGLQLYRATYRRRASSLQACMPLCLFVCLLHRARSVARSMRPAVLCALLCYCCSHCMPTRCLILLPSPSLRGHDSIEYMSYFWLLPLHALTSFAAGYLPPQGPRRAA